MNERMWKTIRDQKIEMAKRSSISVAVQETQTKYFDILFF